MSFSFKEFSDFKSLGNEGFENIILATQTADHRTVILKKLLSYSQQPEPPIIDRLESQAVSACGLDHDNIVRFFGFGKESQSFFIAMEYIDGLDLGRLMRWRPFPREIGLMVLFQTLKGLHYAHERGIVHYNLKPSNILISTTGKVKITDFGLDHARPKITAFNESSSDFMTLSYMPPEVAAGLRDRNVTMDIWSTGVLAYQTICGALPFIGSDFHMLVQAIEHDNVQDIRSADPTLPEDIALEINGYLEKNPEDRPESVDPLRQYLEKFLSDLGIHDTEKMIEKYLSDKNAADNEITSIVTRYYEKKGNEFPNRTVSPNKMPFSETEVFSEAPQTSDVNKEMRSLLRKGSFDNFLNLKKAISFFGITAIIAAAILSVVLIVHNKRKAEPMTSLNTHVIPPPLPMETRSAPDTLHREPTSPTLSPGEYELHADSAAPKIVETFNGKNRKKPMVVAGSANKKIFPVRRALPQKRNPAVQAETAKIGFISPEAESALATVSFAEKKRGLGMLHVHSYPWAEIYIDDIYQGTSPTPKPISLSEGEHRVVLKREGFKTYSETVTVIKDEEKRIKVQLEQ